ncbi:outer membrane protein assembly factor BamD [Candidatus Gillettellia adelgis]
MQNMKYLIVIVIFSLLLSGCSTHQYITSNKPLTEHYALAQKNMQDGNFKEAIAQLETLNKRYPFGPYSQQIQLDLIYSYYKSSNFISTQASIDRLLRVHPTHPNIDYVMYMHGLTDMALNDSTLQSFLRIDCSDRDPQNARAAFHDFHQFIWRFPNSQYVADAHKRLVYLKGRLAQYELSVLKYYMKRGAYIAVIHRAEDMLCKYQDTKATYDALPFMKDAYQVLQLNIEAEKVAKLIDANPRHMGTSY